MPIEHLSQRLELDIRHLLWQASIYELSSQQLNERFDEMAQRYVALVRESDLAQLEGLLRDGLRQVLRHESAPQPVAG